MLIKEIYYRISKYTTIFDHYITILTIYIAIMFPETANWLGSAEEYVVIIYLVRDECLISLQG